MQKNSILASDILNLVKCIYYLLLEDNKKPFYILYILNIVKYV